MRILTVVSGAVATALLCIGLPSHHGGVAAGTAVRMDVPELVHNAELIIEGRVLSSLALHAGHRIETEYIVEVRRTFLGEDLLHRAVRLPGGVLEDGSGMLLCGMPRIGVGENVLLFLTEEGATGVRMPIGLAQGKYTIVERASGVKALVRDAAGVALVNPASGTLSHPEGRVVRDYAEVVAEIEAALATRDR